MTPTLSPYYRILSPILMGIRPAALGEKLKRLLLIKRLIVETPEGKLFIDPISQFGNSVTSPIGYESGLVHTLKSHLKPGDTFVDLGANERYFSVIASRICGPTGRVLAIEPQKRLLSVIAQNLQLNGLHNVEVVNVAVSDRSGQTELFISPDSNTGASGLYQQYKFKMPRQAVTCATLEEVLDAHKLDQVNLLKVDIEGYEYEAILGSVRLFQQRRVQTLALELHPDLLRQRKKDANDIVQFLRGAGYVKSGPDHSSIWMAPR